MSATLAQGPVLCLGIPLLRSSVADWLLQNVEQGTLIISTPKAVPTHLSTLLVNREGYDRVGPRAVTKNHLEVQYGQRLGARSSACKRLSRSDDRGAGSAVQFCSCV